jgi:hypothetical protein
MKATETSTANEANQSETDNLSVEGLTSLLMQGSEPEVEEQPAAEVEETEEVEDTEHVEPEGEMEEVEDFEEAEETEDEEVEPEAPGEIDLTALTPEEKPVPRIEVI